MIPGDDSTAATLRSIFLRNRLTPRGPRIRAHQCFITSLSRDRRKPMRPVQSLEFARRVGRAHRTDQHGDRAFPMGVRAIRPAGRGDFAGTALSGGRGSSLAAGTELVTRQPRPRRLRCDDLDAGSFWGRIALLLLGTPHLRNLSNRGGCDISCCFCRCPPVAAPPDHVREAWRTTPCLPSRFFIFGRRVDERFGIGANA